MHAPFPPSLPPSSPPPSLQREPLMAALLDCHVFVKQLLSPPGDASRDVGVVKGRGYAWTVCLCSLMKYFHKLPGMDGSLDYITW